MCTNSVVYQNHCISQERFARHVDDTFPPSRPHTQVGLIPVGTLAWVLQQVVLVLIFRSPMAHAGMEFIQENLPMVAAVVGTVVGSAGAFLLMSSSSPSTASDTKPAVAKATKPASSSVSAPAAGSDTAAAPSVSNVLKEAALLPHTIEFLELCTHCVVPLITHAHTTTTTPHTTPSHPSHPFTLLAYTTGSEEEEEEQEEEDGGVEAGRGRCRRG